MFTIYVFTSEYIWSKPTANILRAAPSTTMDMGWLRSNSFVWPSGMMTVRRSTWNVALVPCWPCCDMSATTISELTEGLSMLYRSSMAALLVDVMDDCSLPMSICTRLLLVSMMPGIALLRSYTVNA
jgi:hypothetical protein